MKSRKFAAIFITVIMLLFTFPAGINACDTNDGEGQQGFKDVPQSHWAYDQIMWMTSNKIVVGDGKGNFLPNKNVARDEFAKMMVLTLGLKLIDPDESSFLDVKENSWQHKYIETAKPYLTGYKATNGYNFHPSEPAEREDMAVALVKALGFSNETADESVLLSFSDSDSISPNLRKYVAIAVKHELMQGYDKDGKRVFDPQASLNRASAATLLYAAFKGNEEKITFDEEKVTFDNTSTSDGYTVPKVRAEVADDHIVINWDKITSSSFTGYKVVVSREDSAPQYPENGYYAYITDRNTVNATIHAGDGYNGGDIGEHLESGVSYYFSVTALYGDKKMAGNVIKLEMP